MVVVVVVVVVVVIVAVIIILVMEDYGLEVLAKTPGLYQVPKLRNLNLNFFEGWRDGRSDLYYPLVEDK